MSMFLDLIDDKKKDLATQETELVIDVFRLEFDNLTKVIKLFLKHKGKKGFSKGAYQNIAETLFQNGVTKKDGSMLTKCQVGDYMKIVRAERKGETKSKTVVAPVVSLAEPVARPLANPGVSKQVVAVAVVDCFDAVPEKITGYKTMIELGKWDKLINQDFWNTETEILYGQVRLYVIRHTSGVGKKIINVIRSELNADSSFSKSLADIVEQLFNMREKHTGKANWDI